MNKAISLAALLALSSASSNEYSRHNLIRPQAGNIIAHHYGPLTTTVHDDEQMIKLDPKALRPHHPTFSPLDVAHDDEQMSTTILNPQLLRPHYRIFTPLTAADDDEFVYASLLRADDDDEFFVAPLLVRDDEQAENELNFVKSVKDIAKKAAPGVAPLALPFLDDEHDNEQIVLHESLKPIYRISPMKTQDDEAENELNIFSTIGNDIKKAGKFVVQHPEIVTTAAKLLLKDDEHDDEMIVVPKGSNFHLPHIPYTHILDDEQAENELNFFSTIGNDIKKAGKFVVQHPEIVTTAVKLLVKDDEHDDEMIVIPQGSNLHLPHIPHTHILDDEQAENELNILTTIKNDAKKVGKFVVHHPEIVTTAATLLTMDDDNELFNVEKTEQRVHEGIKKAQKDAKAAAENLKKKFQEKRSENRHDSLSNLGELLRDGKKMFHEVKGHRYHDNMNFLEDFKDNNLSIKDKLKGAANWIGDHPQVITEAAKTYQILKGKK